MHRSVCGAVRDLRFAGRFFEQHSSGEVAIVVLTESAGGNNRWIPLGDHWSRERGAGRGEQGAGSLEQGAKSLEQGAASGLYLPGFLMSIGLVLMLLASGIWYFRRTERTFADVI